MKKLLVLALVSAVTNSVLAQLSSIPPPSADDGIVVRSKGINGGDTHWDSLSGLGAYRYTSSSPKVPNMGSPDNILGLSWAASAPASFTDSRSNLSAGTFRSIFVGASAGWKNDFGYTYTGALNGPDSFTLFRTLSADSPGNTVTFGDFADVPIIPGENETFDYWLNGVGQTEDPSPSGPTETGGVYTVIHPTNSTPYVAPGNISWAQSPLMVSTWIPALGTYQDVATYLVGIEDWRLDRGSDNDRNDFLFAIQLFPASGSVESGPPLGSAPVPEPSTYGLFSAAAIFGLVVYRRIRSIDSVKKG